MEAALIDGGDRVSPVVAQSRTGEIKRTDGRLGDPVSRRARRPSAARRLPDKGEAKQVLDEELRKARLGPLYRPEATLQQLVDVFLEQYQGAPSSKTGSVLPRQGDRRASATSRSAS